MEPTLPSSLLDFSFQVVLNICGKCEARRDRKLFEWKKFWLMISELPLTLNARLVQALGRRQLLSDENIGYMINNEITELNLYNCLKSDFTVNLIANKCRRLELLDLGARIPNFNMISASALIPMFANTALLQQIKLSDCIEVNDSVVESIVQNCCRLKVLQLCGCLSITDRALKLIADSCPALNSLDVSRTPVTDDGLCYFASGVSAKTITELLVNECSLVSITSIQQVLKCCPNMNVFCFNGTRATMDSFYETIARPLQIRFDVPLN